MGDEKEKLYDPQRDNPVGSLQNTGIPQNGVVTTPTPVVKQNPVIGAPVTEPKTPPQGSYYNMPYEQRVQSMQPTEQFQPRNIFAPKDAGVQTPLRPTESSKPAGGAVAPRQEEKAQDPLSPENIMPTPTAPTYQQQPLTYRDFRDQMFGSEEEKRKKAQKRAMVASIGDALRHIGNLGYTIKGATPQQYKTMPGAQQYEQYMAGKKERDAMGYQELQNEQKRAMLEAEQARKNAELAEKMRVNDATIANKNADTEFKRLQTKFNIDTYEPRVQKAIYDMVTAKYNGDKAGYEAGMKAIDFQKYPELKDLEIMGEKLKNNKTQADINHTKAQTNKVNKEAEKTVAETGKIRQEGKQHVADFPIYVNGVRTSGNYIIKGENEHHVQEQVVRKLGTYASGKGWIKDGGTYINFSGNIEDLSKGQLSNIYQAIVTHANDPEVQKGLSEMAGESSGNDDPNARPGAVVKRGNGARRGSSSSSRSAD